MFPKIASKYLVSVFALLTFVFMASCDIYKSNESEISSVDKTVCELFSDSVFTEVNAKLASDYNPEWLDANLSGFIASLMDSLEANEVFIEQNHDTAYVLTLGGAEDTSYVILKAQSGQAIIFSAEVVEMNLFDKSGTLYGVTNDKMPLETISGCTELDEGNKAQPVIKLRYEYDLPGGDILIQLIKVEQTASKVFRFTVQ